MNAHVIEPETSLRRTASPRNASAPTGARPVFLDSAARVRRTQEKRAQLLEALCQRLLDRASRDLPRRFPQPGVEISAGTAVEVTLSYLARKGHQVPPADQTAFDALLPHAERALVGVYRRMLLGARCRRREMVALDELEAAGTDEIVLYGQQGIHGDTVARLYNPDDLLAGQFGRECLDFLTRELGMPEARARAILLYWMSPRKSWREVVRSMEEIGLMLTEHERKCLPRLAEAARARLRVADRDPTTGSCQDFSSAFVERTCDRIGAMCATNNFAIARCESH